MLAGAFSCRHLNAHRSDEYIVPEASDGDVTDAACPGRILLVEQQVSLPLFLIKTETDTQATFTSHQAGLPKPHRCSDSRFFDAAGDGFLVIPSFYRKVVNVPGPGTIESYGVIGGDI
jgi:hypothetical protein